MMHDVAVVGAGPVGSYTASRLASQGLRVLLLEEHPVVGEPRHCTGVLGREAFDRFPDLPKDAIQVELKAAWVISPSGERVRTVWFEGQAFVIQRAKFDQAMARMATEAGAELRTSCSVQALEVKSDHVDLETLTADGARSTLKARAAVIASGVSYRLHEPLGLRPPSAHLYCAQTEVASTEIEDVEVYMGQNVALGSFAWAVPLGNGRLRVGVTAHRMASESLERLLAGPLLKDRIHRNGDPVVKRSVPIRPVDSSVADRVLLVGDAAGQVKPTTGGGIYYGLIGAGLAASTLGKAFAAGRFDRAFLMAYDRAWKKALSREMFLGWMGRKVFESLGDEKLNRLVRVCRHPKVAALVRQGADFDWHAKTVLSFLMSPRVLGQLF
jgi:digeranylgeranylglycerophospholipid reductase